MTGITDYDPLLKTASAFSAYMKTMPPAYRKTAFYYYINAHFRFRPDSNHKLKLMTKVRETLEPKAETPEFDAHVSYIERSTSNRMLPLNVYNKFVPSPAFSHMILDIKLYYMNHPVQESKVVAPPLSLTFGD